MSTNTPGTDIQQQTDVELAKKKLEEVAETKIGRKDPRAGENPMLTRRIEAGGRVPDEDRVIREGTVKPKKKKFGQKLKEAMFPEDLGNGSIADHIFFKIVVPSFKRVVYEGLNTALCMALNMDPKTNRIIGGNGNTHTARASEYQRRSYTFNAGSGYSMRNPIADCEWDEETAKDYYNQMLEVAEQYDDLSISNVYSICGLPERIKSTDKNWGWTKAMLTRSDVFAVDRYNERWVIDLPEPRPLR